MEIQTVNAIPVVLLLVLLLAGLGAVGAVFVAFRGKPGGAVAAVGAVGVSLFVLMAVRGGGVSFFFLLLMLGGAAAALTAIGTLTSQWKTGSPGAGLGLLGLAAAAIGVLLFWGIAARRLHVGIPATERHAVVIEHAEVDKRHAEIIHRQEHYGTVSPPTVVRGPAAPPAAPSIAKAESEEEHRVLSPAPPPVADSPYHVLWRRAKQTAVAGVKHTIESVAAVEAAAAEAAEAAVTASELVEEKTIDSDLDAAEPEATDGEATGDESPDEAPSEVAAESDDSEKSQDRAASDIVYEIHEETGAASVSFGGFSSASERPNWAAEPRSDGTMEYHPQGAVMYVSTPALPSPSQAQSALDEKIRGALREYADLKLGRGSGALVVEAAPHGFSFGELVESPEDLYVEANIRRYGEESAAVYTGFARLHFDEFALQRMDEFKRAGVVRARVTGVGILAGAVLAALGIVYGLLRLDSAARGYYTAWLTPVGIVAVIFVSLLALKAASTVAWRLP